MADVTEIIRSAVEAAEAGGAGEGGGEVTEVVDEGAGGDEGGDGGESTEGAEGTESALEGTTGKEGAEGTPTEVKPPVEAGKPEEDAFAKEHGLDPNKKDNRIPQKRVREMVGKEAAKFVELVTGKPLEAGKNPVEVVKAHIAKMPELEQKVTRYEATLGEIAVTEKMIREQPELFLERLPLVNPKFKELLANRSATTPPKEETKPDAAMPKPDYPLGDGKMTYSDTGLQKLIEWAVQKGADSGYTKAKEELDKRFKPLDDQQKAKRESDEQGQKMMAEVNTARKTWPGFTELEKEVYEEINKANAERRYVGLSGAFAIVKDRKHKEELEKNKADREKIRKEVLDESAAAATSTAVTSRAKNGEKDGEEVDPDAPADDPITAAIRKAVRGRK